MTARSHRFGLLLSVTLAGMAVLIIEITAIRMLRFAYSLNSPFVEVNCNDDGLLARGAGAFALHVRRC